MQRRALAVLLAVGGAISVALWWRGGGAREILVALAFLTTALSVALFPIQSTASLLAQLRSERKPPVLALTLHATALAFFGAALVAWLQ
jgi:hypothetical protein